jgi:hypothetical protein
MSEADSAEYARWFTQAAGPRKTVTSTVRRPSSACRIGAPTGTKSSIRQPCALTSPRGNFAPRNCRECPAAPILQPAARQPLG